MEKGIVFHLKKKWVPRMLCAKFGWNWLSGHLEKKILKKFLKFFFAISL